MESKPEQRIADDSSLSLWQKVLLTTDGTVTQLLELYTGQRIKVRKLEHVVIDGAAPILAVPPQEKVLSRTILLCGPTQPYMYAQSLLVLSRLPASMRDAMTQTDTPIGQLWKSEKLETFREVIEYRREDNPQVAGLFGVAAQLLSRSYLIHAGGAPMGLITEKFPATYFAQVAP